MDLHNSNNIRIFDEQSNIMHEIQIIVSLPNGTHVAVCNKCKEAYVVQIASDMSTPDEYVMINQIVYRIITTYIHYDRFLAEVN